MDSLSPYRVLLVDDVPINIDILTSALSGFRIQIAKNGKKALSIMAGRTKPDLVLLDVDMPGMNGYQVCSQIRANREYDSIPIIFITAKTDKESIVKGFAAGGQDYVTKPFDFSELAARVNTHLELKRSKEKLAGLNELLEKRVEERTKDLRSTMEKLEVANHELDTFVYRASHDLKGPTASLLGLVYIGKQFPPGENPDILDRIEQTIVNLNKVLDKLILKYIISQMPVQRNLIDMHALVTEVCQASGGLFAKCKRLYEPGTYPEFYADSALLKIIMSNIIENALIFSPDDNVEITITAERRTDSIVISVEDNGDGIADGVENKVFDLFFRGSMKSRGNGLGLYLVSKAVEKLGGTIELKSRMGEFTIVVMTLPTEGMEATS